jgi:hypothetical protein
MRYASAPFEQPTHPVPMKNRDTPLFEKKRGGLLIAYQLRDMFLFLYIASIKKPKFMKKVIITSVFALVNFIVFGQMNNNFGGPSTTYQMQQNAQRSTQNNNFQRQQFDQQQRNLQRQQQQHDQMHDQMNRNSNQAAQHKDKPKKAKKNKKGKKGDADVKKEPGEEKK